MLNIDGEGRLMLSLFVPSFPDLLVEPLYCYIDLQFQYFQPIFIRIKKNLIKNV